jgi:acylphosphatase
MGHASNTYSSDVEGGAPVALRYAIAGRMSVDEYLHFIAERANWFGVWGWVAANDPHSVVLVAAGSEAMVGALEMACTLGPITAVIERIDVVPEIAPVAAGFEVRG